MKKMSHFFYEKYSNFLWQIIPLIDYAYKERMFKTYLKFWMKI